MRAKVVVGLVLPVLVAVAGSAAAGSEAKCLVRLSYSPETLPLGPASLEALLQSAGVAGAAGRAVYGEKEARFEVSLEVFEGPDDGLMLGAIHVHDGGGGAERVLAELCAALERSLRAAQAGERQRAVDRLELARKHVLSRQEAYAKAQALQTELCKLAGRSDLSRKRVVEEIADLEHKREELQSQLAGAKARENAIAEQIARIAAAVDSGVAKGEVIEQLTKVIELRRRDAEHVQKLVAAGHSPEGELTAALEKEALARAELAERREAIRRETGGDQLAQLNAELLNLTIETAETIAKLKRLEERLTDFAQRNLIELANRYEIEVELRLGMCRAELEEASRRFAAMETDLALLREADVTVIGAAPAPKP